MHSATLFSSMSVADIAIHIITQNNLLLSTFNIASNGNVLPSPKAAAATFARVSSKHQAATIVTLSQVCVVYVCNITCR